MYALKSAQNFYILLRLMAECHPRSSESVTVTNEDLVTTHVRQECHFSSTQAL